MPAPIWFRVTFTLAPPHGLSPPKILLWSKSLSDPELPQQWRRQPQPAPSAHEQRIQLIVVLAVALIGYLLIAI
jgi:hypothetical protein